MKNSSVALLVCALCIPALAADSAKKGTPPAPVDLAATAAKLTPPLVLKDGVISNPQRTEIADGGKAVFEFTIAQAGDYVIHAMANATDEEANSFFVNIDAPPDDSMIWDIEVTNGFEDRIVNWRGNGEAGSAEFAPKVFKLAAGKHQLIVVGREPSQLKSFSIRPAK
jgi:hypothetical protein